MTPVRICISAIVLMAGVGSVAPTRPVVRAVRAEPTAPALPTGPVGRQSGQPGYGTYAWPVRGPVIRGFEPPSDPYGPGHRGIDIGAPFGSPLSAAQDGTVAFAGWVGGSQFISIDHDDGVRSTYSWLSRVDVAQGDSVTKGQAIGLTGNGHPEEPVTHLHFGTRVGDTYVDPMLLLERGSVVGLIHLAPLEDGGVAKTFRIDPALPRAGPNRIGPLDCPLLIRCAPRRPPALEAMGHARGRPGCDGICVDHLRWDGFGTDLFVLAGSAGRADARGRCRGPPSRASPEAGVAGGTG